MRYPSIWATFLAIFICTMRAGGADGDGAEHLIDRLREQRSLCGARVSCISCDAHQPATVLHTNHQLRSFILLILERYLTFLLLRYTRIS